MRRYPRRRFSTRSRRGFRRRYPGRRRVYRRRSLRRRAPVVRMSRRQLALRRPELKRLKSESNNLLGLEYDDNGTDTFHISQLAHTWAVMSTSTFNFGVAQGTNAGQRVGNKICISKIRVMLDFALDPAGDYSASVGQFHEIHVFLLLNRDWGRPADPESSADASIDLPDLSDFSVYSLVDADGFTPSVVNCAMTAQTVPISFGLGASDLRGSTSRVLAAKKLILRADPLATRRRVVLKTIKPIFQHYTSGTTANDVGHNRISLCFFNRGTFTSGGVPTFTLANLNKWTVNGRFYMSYTDC